MDSSTGAPDRPRAIRRGDIYWAAPDDGRGSVPPIAHPHVVLQDDVFNASRIDTVVVCAITSNAKRIGEPGTVLLEADEGGLSRRSIVVASQLAAIPKASLGTRIGALSTERVEQILAALRLVQAMQAGR